MSDHYYSKTPTSESKPKNITMNIRGFSFKFNTDSGVFSKSEIDYGSKLLIDSISISGQEEKILDIGCGYGPIGLSMAKLVPTSTVHMVDVNERAIELANRNAIENNVKNIIIYESYLLDNIQENELFDLIISNPPIRAGKEVIFKLYDDAYKQLKADGELWIVIQKKQGAASTIEKLKATYDAVEVVEKKKGYYIIKSKKY
jgi:16S rRNA (guanine1207-N2)-methyltransferase